jgi:zinc protease
MNPSMLLIGLCLALVAQLSHAGPKIERWQTTSGARVLFVENHSLPIVDVQVDFAAGTAHDGEGRAGVASLTRGILDLGVPGMDETQIASRMADIGALLSGGVDMDRASVTLRTLSMADKRGPALEMLRAILSQPQFPAAVFDREQARSISALKEALTRPDAIASKAFWAAMYVAHPYGRYATPESVSSLARADVVAFHAAHYTAQRATVAIVGDLSRAQAESIAEQLTVGLPSGPCHGRGRAAEIAVRRRTADCASCGAGASPSRDAGTPARRSGLLSLAWSGTIPSAAVVLFRV